MIIKVFWQECCPNCPPAKRVGKALAAEGYPVEYHDVRDIIGLTQAIKFDVKATPSIVVADDQDRELSSWRAIVPTLDEVKSSLW